VKHVARRIRHFHRNQTISDFRYRDVLWEKLFLDALRNTSFDGVTVSCAPAVQFRATAPPRRPARCIVFRKIAPPPPPVREYWLARAARGCENCKSNRHLDRDNDRAPSDSKRLFPQRCSRAARAESFRSINQKHLVLDVEKRSFLFAEGTLRNRAIRKELGPRGE